MVMQKCISTENGGDAANVRKIFAVLGRVKEKEYCYPLISSMNALQTSPSNMVFILFFTIWIAS